MVGAVTRRESYTVAPFLAACHFGIFHKCTGDVLRALPDPYRGPRARCEYPAVSAENATLLKTPFFTQHVALGAKMVPFAGFEIAGVP